MSRNAYAITLELIAVLLREQPGMVPPVAKLLKKLDPAAELPEPEAFIPNDIQDAILAALDGKAMRTDQLVSKVGCDRRAIFRKPGGVQELKDQGLVNTHARLGYYRTDAPPPNLPDPEGSPYSMSDNSLFTRTTSCR